MKLTSEQKHQAALAMIDSQGGSFVRKLGDLFCTCDSYNRERLAKAFEDVFQRFYDERNQLSLIKTLEEHEADSTDGFRNPRS